MTDPHALFDKTSLPFSLGFGCALAWMFSFYHVASLGPSTVGIDALTTNSVYLVSLIAMGLFDFVTIFRPSSFKTFINEHSPWLLCLLMVGSTILIALPNYVSAFALICQWGGTIIAGIASTALLLYWVLNLAVLTVKEFILAVVLSILLSCMANIIVPMSNAMTILAFTFALPLLSGLGLAEGRRRLEKEGRWSQEPLSETPTYTEKEPNQRLILRLGGLFVLWPWINRIMRAEYDSEIGPGAIQLFALSHGFATLIITIIVIAIICLVMVKPKGFHFEHVYRVFFLFSLLSVLLLPTANEAIVIAYACNTTAYQLFTLFMYVIIIALCRNYPSRAVRMFGFCGLCWALGGFLGSWTGALLVDAYASYTNIFIACAVMGYAACYTLVFTEENARALAVLFPASTKKPFKDACERISNQFGLTPRETEVMILIARGYSSSHIEKELFLSKSTIQTHRMHLYQKLDIHSKQELLVLIEQQRAALQD